MKEIMSLVSNLFMFTVLRHSTHFQELSEFLFFFLFQQQGCNFQVGQLVETGDMIIHNQETFPISPTVDTEEAMFYQKLAFVDLFLGCKITCCQ